MMLSLRRLAWRINAPALICLSTVMFLLVRYLDARLVESTLIRSGYFGGYEAAFITDCRVQVFVSCSFYRT